MTSTHTDLSLLQALPLITWTNLPDGDVNFYNQKWYDYTGQTFEQTKEWGWQAVVHPDDLEETLRRFRHSLSTGETYMMELRFRGADGEYRWHLNRALPIRNEAGEIELWIGTATDITDQVDTRTKLQATEFKFRSLVEDAMVATSLLTGRGMKIEIANDMMIALWGKGRSVMGMSLADALPELQGQPFLQMLDDVFTTGVTFSGTATPAQLEVGGVLSTFYFDFSYKAVRDANGEIYGVMDTAIDVTEKVRASQKLEKSQEQLLSYFEQSPVAIATISRDNLTFRMANPFYGEIVGRHYSEIIDKPLLEALPEIKGQGFDILLNRVIDTGVPFIATELPVDIKRGNGIETIYVNLTYQPQRDLHDEVTGVLVVATDVTKQVLDRKKVEESEEHLQLMRDTVPAMIFYLDPEQRYRSYNVRFMDWFKVDATGALGKTVREFIGEMAYEKVAPYLTRAYAGEQVQYHMYAPHRIGGEKWLDIVYTPHKNSEGAVMGIIVHAMDVTDYILASKKIEEGAAQLKTVIESTPAAIAMFVGPDLIIETPNTHFMQLMAKGDAIRGKPFREILSETVEADQVFIQLIQNVYSTGEPFYAYEVEVIFKNTGQPQKRYYNINFIPLRDADHKIYAVLDVSVDVTDQVLVRKKVEGKEKELRDLIASAPFGICVVSAPDARVQEVNERFIEISGKKRELYENATYWEVFPEVAETFAPVLENVFKTGIKYSTPETGMTLVRNGVPEQIYAAFDYIPVMNTENEVTKVIVAVIEVTHQVETRKRIEEAVTARTKELHESNISLQRSNAELEQFAYIASHDLQEPVRKISTFSELLQESLGELSPQSQGYLDKINQSTSRMSQLIRDVLAFSQVSQTTDTFSPVDICQIVDHIRTDFEVQIANTKAQITCTDLPTIDAVPSQMTQLFGNLMSNSLKYIRPGIPPVITLTSTIATKEEVLKHPQLSPEKKYYNISFCDNGIGFDQEHADRIFKIFQRLHGKTEFEGTGIGLSICRKIVQSHHGHISAHVGANGGAVFTILLSESEM